MGNSPVRQVVPPPASFPCDLFRGKSFDEAIANTLRNTPVGQIVQVVEASNVAAATGALLATCVPSVPPVITAAVQVMQGRNVVDAIVEAHPVSVVASQSRVCVLVYDATYTGMGYESSWDFASMFEANRGRFQYVVRARSWQHVAEELHQIAIAVGSIDEMQFWGHGTPGVLWIGHDQFTVDSLQHPEWQLLRHLFRRDGSIWLRTCSTLRGAVGRRFADTLACHFGDQVTVAGHTVPIHVVHNGLVLRLPGHASAWGDGDEGRYCLCTDMTLWDLP